MGKQIVSVVPGSPADRAGIRPGEYLTAVDGRVVRDVLDYKFYTYEPRLVFALEDESGRERKVKIRKEEGEDPGLNFETYLMDCPRSCANRCVFCFVDQLPAGMRETLYFKDDDMRLSFLQGNYITLTNLGEREIERILKLRISPLHISVHAADPEMRSLLLGNKRGENGMQLIRRLAEGGIEMHCQIVLCPGLNDGEQLDRTMRELADLYPDIASVSVVPVGLTAHRDGLYPLKPFDREEAVNAVHQVERFADSVREQWGTSLIFCSDELYLKAELPLPPSSYYEEYPQLENGVGMLRLLEEEFLDAVGDCPVRTVSCSIATGLAAAPFLRELLRPVAKWEGDIPVPVYGIRNRFLGDTIDVAGLVTGKDLIDGLRGKKLGERLLIPATMLRHGEGIFLDDVTLSDVETALGVPVIPVMQDGGALAAAVFSMSDNGGKECPNL